MFTNEGDTIRVDVPVGLLLLEPREIDLSVDRPEAAPLAVKLRLIPAAASVGQTRRAEETEPERMMAATTYVGRTNRDPNGEGLAHEEYGAGD